MVGSKQLLKTGTMTLLVNGSGRDINEATADAFKKLSRQVYKEVGQPVIQMETKEVYFDKVDRVDKKSLIPGKKDPEVNIDARIVIAVKYLDLNKEEE